MNSVLKTGSPWWDSYRLNIDQTRHWDIGPLRLAVRRMAQEWQIFQEETKPWSEEDDSLSPAADEINTDFDSAKGRFVFENTSDLLSLVPMLADRPVVTRPRVPFHVLPGQFTTLYVSSPLWVKIQVHEPAVSLQEIPCFRPSDTWFGPSTRVGELCYASQTSDRLSLDILPRRTYKAITPIQINNQSDDPLLLERVNLPVLYLSLFQSADDYLWTQPVTITRKAQTGEDELDFTLDPPPHMKDARLISEARQKMDKKTLAGKLSWLLG